MKHYLSESESVFFHICRPVFRVLYLWTLKCIYFFVYTLQSCYIPAEGWFLVTVFHILHWHSQLQEEKLLFGVSLLRNAQRSISKYAVFIKKFKPLINLKNRKTTQEFWNMFWTTILWTDEIMIDLYYNDGKKRVWGRDGTARDLKHTSSSYGVGMHDCQQNYFSCVIIDDVAGNGGSSLVKAFDYWSEGWQFKSQLLLGPWARPLILYCSVVYKMR